MNSKCVLLNNEVVVGDGDSSVLMSYLSLRNNVLGTRSPYVVHNDL